MSDIDLTPQSIKYPLIKAFLMNIHLLQSITTTPNYRFQVNPRQLERGEYLKSFEILIKESFNNITWYVFSPNLKFFQPFLHDFYVLNKCQNLTNEGLLPDKPNNKEFFKNMQHL